MKVYLDREVLDKITYLVGSADVIERMPEIPARVPLNKKIIDFLSDVSKVLMKDTRSKQYSDVVALAFWIRLASFRQIEDKYGFKDENIHLGRGVAFHIAPSNVPVNFAYSLVSGLLTGNCNIVRVPSKEFPQVEIISEAINTVLDEYEDFKSYIALVRYNRNQEINDELSSICDIRIVWGGDTTIRDLRNSPLPPRSIEISFADRYSIVVIDADSYLDVCIGEGNKSAEKERKRIAQDFYNDTFFSDQNACTSPRVVVWMGLSESIAEAKKMFWETEHELVSQKYIFQDIMMVNKLTREYLVAADSSVGNTRIEPHDDNMIIRVKVDRLTPYLMEYRDNSGYFYEYDCVSITELKPLVDDKHCQTIGYIGDKNMFLPLLSKGMKGIDRIVPIGHTMDFGLIWDGYELLHYLSRTISIQ